MMRIQNDILNDRALKFRKAPLFQDQRLFVRKKERNGVSLKMSNSDDGTFLVANIFSRKRSQRVNLSNQHEYVDLSQRPIIQRLHEYKK